MSRFQLGVWAAQAAAVVACLSCATACKASERPPTPAATRTPPPTEAPASPRPPDQTPAQAPDQTPAQEEDHRAFFLTALSRGKGVPPQARAVVEQAEEIVAADVKRGVAVTSTRERLGIEGEIRLCITYQEVEPARSALEQIRKLAYGVELLNLEFGQCPPKPSRKP